jgi:hypothetical protein
MFAGRQRPPFQFYLAFLATTRRVLLWPPCLLPRAVTGEFLPLLPFDFFLMRLRPPSMFRTRRGGGFVARSTLKKRPIRQLFAFQPHHPERTLPGLCLPPGSATRQCLGATIPRARMPQSAALHPSAALNAAVRPVAGLMPIAVSGAAIQCAKAALRRTPAP